MKRIIGILAITVLMSVNFALATGNDNAQFDSNQDGSKINLNPKNLPICNSQPYDNCFGVLGNYTGEFHNGNYNGLGKFITTSKSYWISDFIDDKKNGSCKLYVDGILSFDGKCANGDTIDTSKYDATTSKKNHLGGGYDPESKKNSESTNTFLSTQRQTIHPVNDGVKLTMLEVINSCGENYSFNKFNDYADCVRYSYNSYGTTPSSQTVKAFYIFLDEIVEESNRGSYGMAKAKGEMLRAWQSTIDVSNRGATAATTSNTNAESANDLTRLQILQQQQILDQQDQQRRTQLLNEAQRLLGPAKSTNCTSTMVGNTVQTNCY